MTNGSNQQVGAFPTDFNSLKPVFYYRIVINLVRHSRFQLSSQFFTRLVVVRYFVPFFHFPIIESNEVDLDVNEC